MSSRTLEIVRFALVAGSDETRFTDASTLLDALLDRTPGFLRRCLARGDGGHWVDVIEWTSMHDARAAAETLPREPVAAAFLSMIDPASVDMKHLEILSSR